MKPAIGLRELADADIGAARRHQINDPVERVGVIGESDIDAERTADLLRHVDFHAR